MTMRETIPRRKRARRRSPVVAVRKAGPVPEVVVPGNLPIADHALEIAGLMRDQPVIVVEGETGSGKSTQLPKICLSRCVEHDGMIAHTQPRRIAAREVAARVASEIGTRVGDVVGYKVRFGERTGPGTRIKVLTDGMLLAEMERDRDLAAYHTIIVDEAHERSINIDFILGYLKRLIRRRPELRVVVTSATIDTGRFSNHFDHCPVVSVSGRTYPVDVLYRPAGDDDDENSMLVALENGINEVWRHGPGDVLVFLPGEREIREASTFLGRRLGEGVELLPLFARLSPADQKRIFKPSTGRRVVLSTNVAETSLTVPGVRYVVDSGLARVSRYSAAAKVQRLPIEKISQAAANQRAGRCGRVQSGVCVRLYSEEDYRSRAEYTEPEITRTSLASVVLKMKALRLGEIGDFPFIESPDSKQVRSALRLLNELGALNESGELTNVGRELARLPVEPRIGRLLVEGARQRCLDEMLILAAYLSVPDPRVFPREKLELSRQHHAATPKASSDIEAAIALFRSYREQAAALSRRALERWCQGQFLAPFRMREWSDLNEQLALLVKDVRELPNTEPAKEEAIAVAFLAGFLGHVAVLEENGQWRAANGKIVFVHPSSRSFRKPPKWFVAAELVDTGKLYARQVLPVRPDWIERAAGDRIRTSFSDPFWDETSGNVMAYESGALFGITLFSRRRAHLGSADPQAAREVFISQALCEARMTEYFEFARQNQELFHEAQRIEDKLRLPYALVDEVALTEFFDAAIPHDVYSRSTLARWLKSNPGAESALRLPREKVIDIDRNRHHETYPEAIQAGATPLLVDYRHQPGTLDDGVSVRVPLPLVNQFDVDACARQIPGWLEQHVEALLRTLPKARRRVLAPIGARARELSARVASMQGAITADLAAEIGSETGLQVAETDFDPARLPPHLALRIELVDEAGNVIDADRDFNALRQRHGSAAREAFSGAAAEGYPRRGITEWRFGDLPDSVPVSGYGTQVRAYPALVDCDDHVDIELFDNPEVAAARHAAGVLRLVKLGERRLFKDLLRNKAFSKTVLRYAGLFADTGIVESFQDAVIESALAFQSDPPRLESQYHLRLDQHRDRLGQEAVRIAELVEQSISVAFEVRRALESTRDENFSRLIMSRIESLVGPGFPFNKPLDWLPHVPRFLRALACRVEKFCNNPRSEAEQFARLEPFLEQGDGVEGGARREAFLRYQFLLEEYQVSLFAQHLKTSVPVSTKRLERAWKEVISG
jgi:ATP-dependent helicase HrpA